MFTARKSHMVEIFNLARSVTVVPAQAVARIIQPAVLVAAPSGVHHHVRVRIVRLIGLRLESEAAGLSLGHYPAKRDVGQGIVWVTTANVCVNAGEPDLCQDIR